MTRICFVCWGNICRSPLAEAITRRLVEDAGLADRITVDSAGTSAEELGNPPDRRTVAEARRRGLDVDHIAWQIRAADFDRYDLIVAVDRTNLHRLERLARDDTDRAKLRLLADTDVPDPWYGGDDGFVRVHDMVEDACRTLLDELR